MQGWTWSVYCLPVIGALRKPYIKNLSNTGAPYKVNVKQTNKQDHSPQFFFAGEQRTTL